MKSKSKIRSESLVFIITLVGILIFLNLLSIRFFARGDLTANRIFTLSNASVSAVEGLDDALIVKAYFTKNLPGQYATLERHVKDLLEEYAQHSHGNMKVAFIDPAGDEEEEKIAQNLGIQKMPNPDIEKDQATVKEGYRGIAFSYGENTEVIKAVETTVGLEYAITTSIKKLVDNKATVGFLIGHGEPDIEPAPDPSQQMNPQAPEARGAFQTIRRNLDIYDYKQVAFNLNKKAVPDEMSALVISGANMEFRDIDLYYIDQYLMNGGSVAVFIDGVTVSEQQAQHPMLPSTFTTTKNDTNLKALLKHYGIEVGDVLVMDAQSSNYVSRCSPIPLPIPRPFPAWPIVTAFGEEHPVTYGLGGITLPYATTVRLTKAAALNKGLTAKEIAFSSGNSWTVTAETAEVDPCKIKASDNLKSSLPLAAALNGNFVSYFKGKELPKDYKDKPVDAKEFVESSKKPGRLIVVGSSGMPTDEKISTIARIDRRAAIGDFAFVQNVLDWMTNEEDLIAVRMKTTADPPIDKDVSEGKKAAIKYGNIIGIPLAFMLFGLIRWRIRRNPKKSKA